MMESLYPNDTSLNNTNGLSLSKTFHDFVSHLQGSKDSMYSKKPKLTPQYELSVVPDARTSAIMSSRTLPSPLTFSPPGRNAPPITPIPYLDTHIWNYNPPPQTTVGPLFELAVLGTKLRPTPDNKLKDIYANPIPDSFQPQPHLIHTNQSIQSGQVIQLESPKQTDNNNNNNNNINQFRCLWGDCNGVFSTRTGLATHCSLHLEDYIHCMPVDSSDSKGSQGQTNLMSCKWNNCNDYFADLRQLAKHLAKESHIGQTPFIPKRESPIPESSDKTKKRKRYVCSIEGCGKSFTDSSNRKKHERTHDKNRERFFCDQCEKSYSTKTDLNIHLKVHKGEFPHSCTHPNCSKAFVRLSELYAHERTHDNILPHVCLQCGKRFREKSRLKRHQELHALPWK